MQPGGRGPAERGYFAGAPQKALVLLRQRIDALRQPLNRASRTAPDLQSRRLPSSIPAFVGQIGNQRPSGAGPTSPLKNSTAALPFQQIPWFDEIQQVEMQLGENLVRHFQ